MFERKVTFSELDFPDVLINGAHYYMLCEFYGRDGICNTVYAQEEAPEVVIQLRGHKAIVDLFSREEKQLPRLFNYIESNLRHADDLISYASFDMKTLLMVAKLQQRRYPLLEQAVEGRKPNMLSRAAYRLSTAISDNRISPEEIQAHTVPIEYVRRNTFRFDIEEEQIDSPQFGETVKEEPAARVATENESISFMLGKHDISQLMREVEGNAWIGGERKTISLFAGTDVITVEGYVYEPTYEYFSATSSIALNGQILYGLDARNVDAYRNEVYHTGIYHSLDEALNHIREATKGKEIVSQPNRKQSLTDKIKGAATRQASPTPDQIKSNPEINR